MKFLEGFKTFVWHFSWCLLLTSVFALLAAAIAASSGLIFGVGWSESFWLARLAAGFSWALSWVIVLVALLIHLGRGGSWEVRSGYPR